MTSTHASGRKLAIGTIVFLFLGIGTWTIGYLSIADLLRAWGTDQLSFGPGMFAAPASGAFLIGVAVCSLRAMSERRQPLEMMGRGMLGLGIAALVSIVLAPAGGLVVADALQAESYRRCPARSPSRFGFGTWVRPPAACSLADNLDKESS